MTLRGWKSLILIMLWNFKINFKIFYSTVLRFSWRSYIATHSGLSSFGELNWIPFNPNSRDATPPVSLKNSLIFPRRITTYFFRIIVKSVDERVRNDLSALDLFNFGCLPTLRKNWFNPWQRFVTNSTEKRSSTPFTACFDGNGGIIHPKI